MIKQDIEVNRKKVKSRVDVWTLTLHGKRVSSLKTGWEQGNMDVKVRKSVSGVQKIKLFFPKGCSAPEREQYMQSL